MTTIILTTDEIKARLFILLANQDKPKFISVKNYTNNEGETSNYVINIGADYGKAKESDTVSLLDADGINAIDFGKVKPYSEEARIALLEANLKITKESQNRSDAQADAYETICNNVRLHIDSGRLFVYGMRISKTVLVPGNYGPETRKPLTIAKDKIRETLKATKFRQFAIDKISEIKMNGETLEFEL